MILEITSTKVQRRNCSITLKLINYKQLVADCFPSLYDAQRMRRLPLLLFRFSFFVVVDLATSLSGFFDLLFRLDRHISNIPVVYRAFHLPFFLDTSCRNLPMPNQRERGSCL